MSGKELQERLSGQQAELIGLIHLWRELIPSYQPPDAQFKFWRIRHGFEVMHYSIEETAAKLLSLGTMTPEHLVRFCSSVANATSKKREGRRVS
jgi:hypothetical protein